MQDEIDSSKEGGGGGGGGDYDRLALTESVDWTDDPVEAPPADEEEIFPPETEEEGSGDGLFRDNLSLRSQDARRSFSNSFWTKCLLSDNRFSLCGVELVDGPPVVKLLKFLALTMGAICIMYKFVRAVVSKMVVSQTWRVYSGTIPYSLLVTLILIAHSTCLLWQNWEHKESFTLQRFWTYESTQVVSDTVVFFVVARLWKQKGVDHLAWLLCLVASNLFMSYLPHWRFLQASFTLYDMHCKWSWKLWIFVFTLIPLIVVDVFLHVRHAVQRGIFVRKILELVLAVILLFLPYVSSPYFHLHHWFAGWWVGMYANFDTWWSRATLAWCWGLYVNGIAAYGRDPVLTCGYALFLAEQNRCPFLDCYLDGIATPDPVTNHTTTVVQPMVKPDWRNCSADAYHP